MTMAEEVDKLSRIYSVLTDEEVEAWVSSEEDPKLPSDGVTAAFREAESLFEHEQDGGPGGDSVEINYRDIDIPRLSEVLSELVWRIVGGTLSVDIAIGYLASDKPFQNRLGPQASAQGEGGQKEEEPEKAVEATEGAAASAAPLMEALCDTVWGVDVMVRGTRAASDLSNMTDLQTKQWGRLCSFVQRLHADKLVEQRLLLVLCSEEVLEGSRIVAQPTLVRNKWSTPLARAMLKKGTDMMYKQHRFNLQREETEGFAKLLVLVAGVRDGSKALRENEAEENMRRIIGYFDLDPNRSLDLTLDALEADPSNHGLLRLVGIFNKDTIPHVVGFKLAHYRNPSVAKYHRATVRAALKNKEIDLATYKAQMDKVTPRSLYLLIAVLLTTGTLSMEDLLKRVSPGIVSLKAKEKEYMADLESKLAKAGSSVVKLDADGNVVTTNAAASSTNAMSKLGSMGALASGGGGGYGGGYGGGMMGGGGGGMMGGGGGMGSGTLYAGRDRDRMGMGMGNGHGYGGRDGRDGRDGRRGDSRDRDRDRDRVRDGGRRQSGDNSNAGPSAAGGGGAKANGSAAAGASGGAVDGQEADDTPSPGMDNQLYGVLEALIDIRAWTLASGLLARLAKEGVDPLRDSGVREALKRLIYDCFEGLAKQLFKPVVLVRPGTRGSPAAASAAGGGLASPISPMSPMSGMTSDMEEAEAGEVKLPAPSNGGMSNMLSPTGFKTQSASADLKNLHRLPGYGTGFRKAEVLSELVPLLAPLLKILGPHLGRDPIMFARVCRLLAAVTARNPLNVVSKTSSRRSSNSTSTSASTAAKLAAANSAAAPAYSASTSTTSGSAQGKEKSNGTIGIAATAGSAAKNMPVAANDAPKDSFKEAAKTFHTLFGLSQPEAKEVYSNAEAQGGDGQAALQKEVQRRKGGYIRLLLTVAPCLGMTHANPGMQREVWAMLAELPYEDRFMLYGAWRGHGMEKHALGVKHVQFAVAEIASGAEISRWIKMLTSDNVKEMARKLGKSSHSHPLLFAEKVLNQLESYDNFISMVADSMAFVGSSLGLDCVAYTMVQHLCQTNRSFVSDSGLTLERWVSNLSTFAGLLHRKQPETDCKPILSWAVRALGEGGESAMAAGKVLREVLHKAGGVQVLDGWSITQAQVDGKGGGDVLRQENASFGATVKLIKKARASLQDGMEKAGASLALLILPAHQSESLLYEGGSLEDQMRGKPQPHLKVLAHRADETQTTLLQAIEFVCSRSWLRTKSPSMSTLLTKYELEPRVAFQIWRPVINESLMKYWFPKTGTKSEKDQRDEAAAKRFIADLEASIAKLSIVPDSSPLTAKLVLIFWALALPDVYIPTKKYAAVVFNMNEAKRRAESKLSEEANKLVELSKAEKARYLSERKTCPALAAKLDAEKATQAAHVKRVKNKLKEIKASLFSDQKHRSAEAIDAVLKHLVAPRIGMGPEEAFFCSKFFNTLHAIEAPNFNSLHFYTRSFEGMSSTLLCKTQYEAASLGFFLKDLLENSKEWRNPKNEAIFKMEAGNKHGFNLNLAAAAEAGAGAGVKSEKGKGDGKAKPPKLTHAAFVEMSGKWSWQVTNSLLAAVSSNEFLLIKSGLIMLNKLIETFPLSQDELKKLVGKLTPLTDKDKEARDDIRVPCTRIVNQLNTQIEVPAPDLGDPAAGESGAAAAAGAGTGKSASSSTAAAGKPKPSASDGKDGKGSSLSAAAKPFVPPTAKVKGGSGAASSSTSTSAGGQAAAAAAKKQSSSPSSGGGSNGSGGQSSGKKDQASSSSSTAAGGTAGAAKRAREGGEAASTSAARPTKTARVAEQGEVVLPDKAAAGSGSGSGSSSGRRDQQHQQHQEGKQATPTPTPRDSKPLQKPSSTSNTNSGGGSSGGGSKTAAPRSSATSTSTSTSRTSSATASSSSGRVDASKQQQQQQQQQGRSGGGGGGGGAASTTASASGSGAGSGGSSRGRVARNSSTSSGGNGGAGSNGGAAGDRTTEQGGRERERERDGRGRDGESRRERERQKERDAPGRMGDADSRAKAMASQDMERPAAREPGTGTLNLAGRRSRDVTSRDAAAAHPHGTISRTNSSSSSSRMGGSGRSTPERSGGRGDAGRRDSREDARGSFDDGGGAGAGGRFEGPVRPGGGRGGGGQRTVEITRSGGGSGSTRGSKRGRSVDSDRGGGRDAGFDDGFDGEGDPSQAFDSKRMRQPDPVMLEPEGGRAGSSRSSVEAWGRAYSGSGSGALAREREREREREGSTAPGDVGGGSGRYRDEGNPRHGYDGGSDGSRMPMPSREVIMERPAYDRGGSRTGRSGGGGGMEAQDRNGGAHRGARPVRELAPEMDHADDDVRSRSSRDGKKSRNDRDRDRDRDRQRSSGNRGEDGGGGGGSRKEKKKSSKSKKKKH